MDDQRTPKTNKERNESNQQNSAFKNSYNIKLAVISESESMVSQIEDQSPKEKNASPQIETSQIKGIKNIDSKVKTIFLDKNYQAKQFLKEGIGINIPESDDNFFYEKYGFLSNFSNDKYDSFQRESNRYLHDSLYQSQNIMKNSLDNQIEQDYGEYVQKGIRYNSNLDISQFPEKSLNLHDFEQRLRLENLRKQKIEALCDWKKKDERGIKKNYYIKEQKTLNDNIFIVAKKDDIEQLDVYVDRFPLLKFRKFIMRIISLVQLISFKIVKSQLFHNFILLIIVTNSLFMMSDDPMRTIPSMLFDTADIIFLDIYIFEMFIKIIGLGLIKETFEDETPYLQDPWNILDGSIVIASIVTNYALPSNYQDSLPSETGNTPTQTQLSVSSLRVLRVLRPLRTVSSIKGLKVLMQALFSAMPLLVDTLLVLLFYFLIGGIAGQQIFSGTLKQHCVNLEAGVVNADYTFGLDYGMCGGYGQCPAGLICAKANISPNFGVSSFDNVIWGMINWYYAITLEGWSEIQKELQYTNTYWIWIAFTPLVFLGAFFLLNLLLAVLNSKFSEATSEQLENERKAKQELSEQNKLENDHKQIKKNDNGLSILQFITARIYAKKMIEFLRMRREIKKIEQERIKKIRREQLHTLKINRKNIETSKSQINFNTIKANTVSNNQYAQSKTFIQHSQDESFLQQIEKKETIIEDVREFNHEYSDKNDQQEIEQNILKDNIKEIQNQFNEKLQIPRNIQEINYIDQNLKFKTIDTSENQFQKIKGNLGPVKKGLLVDSKNFNKKQITFFEKFGDVFDIDNVIPKDQQKINLVDQNQIIKSQNSFETQVKNEIDSVNDQSMLLQNQTQYGFTIQYDQKYEKEVAEDSGLITSDSDFDDKANSDLQNLVNFNNSHNISINYDIKKDVSSTFKKILTLNHKTRNQSNNQILVDNQKDYQNHIKNSMQLNDLNENAFIELKFKKKVANLVNLPSGYKFYKEDQVMQYNYLEDRFVYKEKNQDSSQIARKKEDLRQLEEFVSTKRPRDPFRNLNPLKQKVVLNKRQKYICSSGNDIFEERINQQKIQNKIDKNEFLMEPNQYNENVQPDFRHNLYFRPINEAYQQKTKYKIIQDLDLSSESSYSANEDEICAQQQPWDTTTRINYKDLLKQIHLNEILKRSDISITSTLSLNLFPKDQRKINNINYSKMRENDFFLYTTEKNFFKQLEQIHVYRFGHSKDKHQMYRNKYVTSFIYRRNFKTNTLIKFKNKVSNLNRIKKEIPIKDEKTIKDEMIKFDQNKRAIQKKGIPNIDFENAKKLIEGNFHEQDDDEEEQLEKYKKENFEQNQLQYLKQSLKKIIQDDNVINMDIDEMIPIDIKQEFNIPDKLDNLQIDFNQIRKNDASKKRKTPIWSGQDILPDSLDVEQSEFIIEKINSIRVWPQGLFGILKRMRAVFKIIVRSGFDNLFTFIVLLNTVVLALQSYGMTQEMSDTLEILNNYFTYLFLYEMLSKIIAYGIKKYCLDRMNLLDGIVVLLSLFEIIYSQVVITQSSGQTNLKTFKTLRLIRTFRVFRIARLLRALESMQTILHVMNKSYISFLYITILLFLFILIFSLLGMAFFHGLFLNYPGGLPKQNWDSINFAIITSFNIMQSENWNNIIYQIAWAAKDQVSLYIGMTYLVVWFFIGNYILLNLFLSVLLDSFLESPEEEEDLEIQKLKKLDKNQKNIESIKRKEKHVLYMIDSDQKNNKKLLEIDEAENIQDLDEDQISSILRAEGILNQEKNERQSECLYLDVECNHSLYLFSKDNKAREICYRIIHNKNWDNGILAVIILSSLKLASDTYNSQLDPTGAAYELIKYIDFGFNAIFGVEMVIKVISLGFMLDKGSYLRDRWNILDFCIVFSSFLDMSLSQINLPFIKVVRLLRILRPLRFISHNRDLKLIVVALLESFNSILNIVVVITVVFLIFAIIGVSQQGGKYFRCTISPYIFSTQNECILAGGDWYTYQSNFDNVANAYITLFIIANGEGWPNNMVLWMDSQDVDIGPSLNNNANGAIAFFIIFIMIGQQFFINFFIGVLFLKFEEAKQEEEKGFTQDDITWQDIQKLIISSEPDYEFTNVPQEMWRKQVHVFVTSREFDIFIITIIIMNVLMMAIQYENMHQSLSNIIIYSSYFFNAIFIIEAGLKLVAFGLTYFSNGWNRFDIFVVTCAVLDIILNNINAQFLDKISFAPALAKVMRVLRVTRIIKLANKAQGLKAIIETIQFAIKPLSNVTALVLLIYYMFSILGNALFKGVVQGDIMDPDYKNFDDWHHSILALFVFSTGEDWPKTMFQSSLSQQDGCIMNQNCGSHFAYLFFMTMILFIQYIMLSLFVLVILEQFEKYYLPKNNNITLFKKDTEQFMEAWREFTQERYNCYKIKENQLTKFFRRLGEQGDQQTSLGYHEDFYTDGELKKELLKMGIKSDNGYIYYNELLYRCMRKKYGNMKLSKNMQIVELRTQYAIFRKTLQVQSQNIALTNNQIYDKMIKKQNGVNPFLIIMNYKISFKTWLKHARNIIKYRESSNQTYLQLLKELQYSFEKEYYNIKNFHVVIEMDEYYEVTSDEEVEQVVVFKSKQNRRASTLIINPVQKRDLLRISKKFSSIVFLEKKINKKLKSIKQDSKSSLKKSYSNFDGQIKKQD